MRVYWGLRFYNAEGGAGAAGAAGGGSAPAGTQPAGAAATAALTGGVGAPAPALPWGDGAQPWTIGEKPWYEHAGLDEKGVELMRSRAYKTPADVTKAYYELNKQFSAANMIPLPNEADPTSVEAFYDKLGRPKTPDAYDFKVPDTIAADTDMVKFGKEVSHKLGLDPKRAQTLVDQWNEFAVQRNTQIAEAERVQNETAVNALFEKWGGEGKLNELKAAGLRTVRALGPEAEEIAVGLEKHIGSAAVIHLLAKLGSMTGEGQFKTTGGGGDPSDPANMTAEQATAEIAKMQADPNYHKTVSNMMDPNRTAMLQRMEALYAATSRKR